MEKREQARKLYVDFGGKTLLKDIAAKLGVKESTLRQWKRRDNWDGKSVALQTSVTSRQRRAVTNRKAAETLEANDKLTDREKKFCAAYVQAPNPSQAAMLTGNYSTYGSARVAAFNMMRKPAVVREIKKLKVMKHAMMLADADDVIEMHMRIAFADMNAFVEFGQEEVAVMGPFGPIEIVNSNGEKVTLTKSINTVRFREHIAVDGTLISQIKQGRDGASVKLKDSQKSLEFLERYFELNPMDRHRKEFDEKKLKIADRQVKIQEDKLHGLTADMDDIKANMRELMDIVGAPVPDRRLEDE